MFFTYIMPKESRSISYNSVYFILTCTKNFAAIVKLNVLCLPCSQEMNLMTISW